MAGRVKHMERSHYSYGESNHIFGSFERKASIKKARKVERKTLVEGLKSFFHKTTNK